MTLDLKQYTQVVRVSDGAWGTELQKRGLDAGASPDMWNADNPSAVEEVARSYVDAGSDVIITNTFGANKFVLAGHGAAERAAELTEIGVAISKKAVEGTEVKVFASLSPTGKIVMMGEAEPAEIEAAYAECAAAAQTAGADAIVLETFAELDEIKLAINGVKLASSLPIIASMTFDSGPDQTSTMMGGSPEDLVALAEACGAAAVGANCGLGPENYVKITEKLRAATDLPVWIKANAGQPAVQDGKTIFPSTPEQFASFIPRIIDAGANFIGGCCGTTPEFIRAIRTAVDAAR